MLPVSFLWTAVCFWFLIDVMAAFSENLGTLYLRPFSSNEHIHYLYLNIPPHVHSATVVFLMKEDSKCGSLVLELLVKPRSIPNVRPFGAPLPPAVVQTPEVYHFFKKIDNHRNASGNLIRMEFPFYVFELSDWFGAIYLTGGIGTDNRKCAMFTFAHAVYWISTPMRQIFTGLPQPSVLEAETVTLRLNSREPVGLSFRNMLGVSSADVVLSKCTILQSPFWSRYQTMKPISLLTECPLIVGLRSGGIPRMLPRQYAENHSNTRSDGSKQAPPIPGTTIRLDNLHADDRVENYLLMQSNQLGTYISVEFKVISNFDCAFSSRANRFLMGNDPVEEKTSLLPWLNPAWADLLGTVDSVIGDPPVNDGIVTVGELVKSWRMIPKDRRFKHCTIWPLLDRNAWDMPFHVVFSYKNLHDVVQLKPWHLIQIPFELTPFDTGGTLEVSLQLEPLDITKEVNGEKMKISIDRQIILHGCLSRRMHTTPTSLTNAARCPLWLRLATSNSQGVSVAQALRDLLMARDVGTLDFDERFDRNHLFTVYPAYGRWYLTLYAECYTPPVNAEACSIDTINSGHGIDVAFILRLSPCVRQRCRELGEPSAFSPARGMEGENINEQATLFPNSRGTNSYRPTWWWKKQGQALFRNRSVGYPLPGDSDFSEYKALPRPSEGVCGSHQERSLFVSICICPPGRVGFGCVRVPQIDGEPPPDLQNSYWPQLSASAKLLVWSNLAFLPSIIVAIRRRLWICAIAYAYTMLFSTIYHVCDTDILMVPVHLATPPILTMYEVFDGLVDAHPEIYRVHGYVENRNWLGMNSYNDISTNASGVNDLPSDREVRVLRFTNLHCPLPAETLSMCDFFGAAFSIVATVVTVSALPPSLSEVIYVALVLVLSVSVQVARYSIWYYFLPCTTVISIMVCSWAYRSVQLQHLFPPIQWLAISFIPGVLLACTGISIFINPRMESQYAYLHSLWHIAISLATVGIMPWPRIWRRALLPAVPLSAPLSCGGATKATSVIAAAHAQSSLYNNSDAQPHYPHSISHLKVIASSRRCLRRFRAIVKRLEAQWEEALMLRCVLDPLLAKFPRLEILVPNGYIPAESTTEIHPV